MVELLLCDADGNLFPSEEPAFAASAEVTNACLASLGVARRYEPEELRLASTGRNFRSTIVDLAREAGVQDLLTAELLERWVTEERRAVTAHLRATLTPDPGVLEPLSRLHGRFALAAVSSSALARLDACFAATGLDALFPRSSRYSAEDSLDVPASKPDPAIYALAGRRLGATPLSALAIEDSLPGAQSAVAAGFVTIGNVMFVPASERDQRRAELLGAGVAAVVDSWVQVEALLAGRASG
jgi:beta-phosphoglucomutase-like phosphatase (HAD superfamily)